MLIRTAEACDLAAINDIYNHYVAHSTCTYQLEAETLAARTAWFEQHGPQHPVIIAESDGLVVGWGSLSPFRGRAGYGGTVENSVYVRAGLHGRGIGSALLAELLQRATVLRYHTIIAGCDSQQTASIALHEKFGYERVAFFREVGRKFDQWLNVVFLQKML